MFVAEGRYCIRGEVFGALERPAASNGLVDSVPGAGSPAPAASRSCGRGRTPATSC